MSTEAPTAPEGATEREGRELTDAELKRYAEELQKAVGRAGVVTVEERKLHLYVVGRRAFRACARAARGLRHWPAGVVVVTHRVPPKLPETAEELRERVKAAEAVRSASTPEEPEEDEARPRGRVAL